VDDNVGVPRLPDGDPAPASGELPDTALATLATSRFGIYLHVPYCSVRCGYCDFNTYTLPELGPGASTATFADQALAELDLAVTVLGEHARPVETVFVGGGTPTLLPAADLVRCVDGIRQRFGLAPGAEVTTEANPDSVTPGDLEELAAGGFTRRPRALERVEHLLAAASALVQHDEGEVGLGVDGQGREQVGLQLVARFVEVVDDDALGPAEERRARVEDELTGLVGGGVEPDRLEVGLADPQVVEGLGEGTLGEQRLGPADQHVRRHRVVHRDLVRHGRHSATRG
jgi:hypothetical protein